LSSRAPIERIVDRVCRVFVPLVVLLALLDLGVLLAMHSQVADALLHATTILVIACPCALGLATPLAVTAAVGSASQAGLLISDASVLESMEKIDVAVLDKTGTLTRGDFCLVDHVLEEVRVPALAMAGSALDAANPRREIASDEEFMLQVLPILSGIEAYSEHLLGRALLQYARDHRVQPLAAGAVEIHKGQGISGSVDGRRVLIGNRQLMTSFEQAPYEEADQRAEQLQSAGHTVAFFAWEGAVRGMLAFGDEIKPGAAETVKRLKARGIRVKLVSGDAWSTTAVVANQIGIDDYVAEAAPSAKCAIVAALQKEGKHVTFIGDGVNDAPALAQADLGIALGTGADIATGAARMVLMSGSLLKLEDAFQLAAKTTRIVRQNLIWAFFYNIAGITLAILGVLTPIYAAAAMLLSSTSVVLNSMRLAKRQEGV
jgi:heavy metal translocating P-type ATPase